MTQSTDNHNQKQNWLKQYTKLQEDNEWFNTMMGNSTTQSGGFPTLFPISQRIAAQTIGLDLVSVQPMDGISLEKRDEIKRRIQAENRDGSVDSILDGTTFVPKKIEDDEEYKSLVKRPSSHLMYLDFKYEDNNGVTQSNNNDGTEES